MRGRSRECQAWQCDQSYRPIDGCPGRLLQRGLVQRLPKPDLDSPATSGPRTHLGTGKVADLDALGNLHFYKREIVIRGCDGCRRLQAHFAWAQAPSQILGYTDSLRRI